MLLLKEGELCVCECSQIIGSMQPKVSRHLALMRKSGLVSDKRRGQWVYYNIHPALPDWARKIVGSTVDNLMNKEPYRTDLKKVRALRKCKICQS